MKDTVKTQMQSAIKSLLGPSYDWDEETQELQNCGNPIGASFMLAVEAGGIKAAKALVAAL